MEKENNWYAEEKRSVYVGKGGNIWRRKIFGLEGGRKMKKDDEENPSGKETRADRHTRRQTL